VKENAPDASAPLDLKGKNIIVGVPGAFTGTCHAQVPDYIKLYGDFRAKGINEIYIVAVNDTFVTKAWKDNLAPEGTDVRFIADDNATFSASIGLAFDASPVLGNPRSLRYAAVTEGNTVTSLFVEPIPTRLTITAAAEVLASL